MPVPDVLARVAELEELARRVAVPVPAPRAPSAAAPAASLAFAAALAAAQAAPSSGSWPTAGGGSGPGASALAAATAEVGVAEEPPGSNDGVRIAAYRTAVAGAQPGQPWCAYFVSWAAAQAGAPLGETGTGLGSVEEISAWAARTGRLLPTGTPPAPGDLVLFGGEHVGIVESVAADGTLSTVEGNHDDAVGRAVHAPTEPTGFVRL